MAKKKKAPLIRSYPKTWNVMGVKWKVVFKRNLFGNCISGLCDPATATIYVKLNQDSDPEINRQEIFKTFIHEALHAIEYEMGREVPHHFIDMFELGVADMLLTNNVKGLI